ncbi:MAG TPA: hypothetical protein VFZ65_20935 [Planctomycetota bacterium]|nr:hypothetical protein [Planctomycetota bacterium]
MRALAPLSAGLVLAVVPPACSSSNDAGGLAAADFEGEWQVTFTTTDLHGQLCGGSMEESAVGATEFARIEIRTVDGVVMFQRSGDEAFPLDLSGDRARGTLEVKESRNTTTSTVELQIVDGRLVGTEVATATTKSGTVTVTQCRQTLAVDGVRATASPFNGVWQVTQTVTELTGGACTGSPGEMVMSEVHIVVGGSTATLATAGEEPVVLALQGGRLSGTNGDDTIQIELTSSDSFSGTVTSTLPPASPRVCTIVYSLEGTRLGY